MDSQKIFPSILFLIATPLIFGGLQLLFLGGSFYYLIAGLALSYSAWCLWNKDPRASLVYGVLLFFTAAWSFMESGTNLWALAPRTLPFVVLGFWFLTPWLRGTLYKGSPPPLFLSPIAKAVPILTVAITIFIFMDGTGFDVQQMSERSGINTVNTQTDWPSYGLSLIHI